MSSACDVIENWEDTAYSGEGGRLDQLRDVVADTMETWGYDASDVEEQPGLMDSEGVPARYDEDSNTIYFDPGYLASDQISPDEAIYLAIHESLHALDKLEDGSIDVGEADIAAAAFGMTGDATAGCVCQAPESGGEDGGDTGGW